MVARGQVEILGGGYYDPILPLIPTNDKLGQLEKMTTLAARPLRDASRAAAGSRKRSGSSPWPPCSAPAASTTRSSTTASSPLPGVNEDELFMPFITEDQGKIISLFPVSGTHGGACRRCRSVRGDRLPESPARAAAARFRGTDCRPDGGRCNARRPCCSATAGWRDSYGWRRQTRTGWNPRPRVHS